MECCSPVAPRETSRARNVERPIVAFAIPALVCVVSAAFTVAWSRSMSGGMPMPGGWTMSMMWMRMPGQTWPEAAASFLVMWIVMMTAMMVPSLVPPLRRYRAAVGRTGAPRVALAGAGYFLVWTVVGAAVFPVGAALTTVEMQQPALARAVPVAIAVVFVIAGALQFAPWKSRALACCRGVPGGAFAAEAGSAWRYGVRLGLDCVCACAGPTMILLAGGIMDLRLMAAVTTAITAERLAPDGDRVARATGVIAAAVGLLLVTRTLVLA